MGENAIRIELTCSFDCLIGIVDAAYWVLVG
jgi:hypothetical protein